MTISSQFQPIDSHYYELIEELIQNKTEIKIFYFINEMEVGSMIGIANTIILENQVEYLKFNSGERIRIDRLITINGKPGPLYAYYDSLGAS